MALLGIVLLNVQIFHSHQHFSQVFWVLASQLQENRHHQKLFSFLFKQSNVKKFLSFGQINRKCSNIKENDKNIKQMGSLESKLILGLFRKFTSQMIIDCEFYKDLYLSLYTFQPKTIS